MVEGKLLIGAISVLAGVVAFLFYRLEAARTREAELHKAIATERQSRLDFVEAKLVQTELREGELAKREASKDAMIADFIDLTKAQTRGGIQPAPGRRSPMGSNPRG